MIVGGQKNAECLVLADLPREHVPFRQAHRSDGKKERKRCQMKQDAPDGVARRVLEKIHA